jgi:hypothetical protein
LIALCVGFATMKNLDLLSKHIPLAVETIRDVIKHGEDNHRLFSWVGLGVAGNMAHFSKHMELHARGDTTEDHLAHASCRLLMAIELRERGK